MAERTLATVRKPSKIGSECGLRRCPSVHAAPLQASASSLANDGAKCEAAHTASASVRVRIEARSRAHPSKPGAAHASSTARSRATWLHPEQGARRPHPAFGIDAVNAMLARRLLHPPGSDGETCAGRASRRQRAPPSRVGLRSHPQAGASRTAPAPSGGRHCSVTTK